MTINVRVVTNDFESARVSFPKNDQPGEFYAPDIVMGPTMEKYFYPDAVHGVTVMLIPQEKAGS